MILITDLCNEIPPGISFAWEPEEKNLLELPPRKALVTAQTMTKPEILEHRDKKSLFERFKNIFKYELHTGEVLVDGRLLLLAYLNAGTFIAIGAYANALLTLNYYNVNFSDFFGGVKTYWMAGSPELLNTLGEPV